MDGVDEMQGDDAPDDAFIPLAGYDIDAEIERAFSEALADIRANGYVLSDAQRAQLRAQIDTLFRTQHRKTLAVAEACAATKH
jgi:hypothetical protein